MQREPSSEDSDNQKEDKHMDTVSPSQQGGSGSKPEANQPAKLSNEEREKVMSLGCHGYIFGLIHASANENGVAFVCGGWLIDILNILRPCHFTLYLTGSEMQMLQ